MRKRITQLWIAATCFFALVSVILAILLAQSAIRYATGVPVPAMVYYTGEGRSEYKAIYDLTDEQVGRAVLRAVRRIDDKGIETLYTKEELEEFANIDPVPVTIYPQGGHYFDVSDVEEYQTRKNLSDVETGKAMLRTVGFTDEEINEFSQEEVAGFVKGGGVGVSPETE